MSHTNGGVLSTYGGGEWPMLTLYELGMMADNGNYLEPDEVAVRRGVCGDPNEVRVEGWNFAMLVCVLVHDVLDRTHFVTLLIQC